LFGLEGNYMVDPASMPTSVAWQRLQVTELCMSAARLLPPSALAALAGPFSLQLGIQSGSFNYSLIQLREAVDNLAAAQRVRDGRGGMPRLLEDCTLRAVMVPSLGSEEEADMRHQLLLSWIYALLFLTQISHLGLHRLCLEELSTAGLSDSTADSFPADFHDAITLAEASPQRCRHFLTAVQHESRNLLTVQGAVLADAFPDLHTLELEQCDIDTSLLCPLLSTAPLKSLQLCDSTQLHRTATSDSLQALLDALPQQQH
jgi:hypothetical protein